MTIAASVTNYEKMNLERMEMLPGAKQLKEAGKKILVVNLPMTGEWVLRRFFESCLVMCAGSAYQFFESQNVRMLVNICSDFPIDYNRNKSARVAIEKFVADYIMNLDTDQTFKASTIIDLWTRMHQPAPDGSEIEVLAGMYFIKNPPFRPVLGPFTGWEKGMDKDYLDKMGFVCHGECGDAAHANEPAQLIRWSGPHYWPDDKLFRADVIGVGCVLSKASMWKKLDYPFFRYSANPMTGQANGNICEVSEDMLWCANMHRAGVKVWIDPTVQCGHVGVLEANRELFRGAFEATVKHIDAMPEGSPEAAQFRAGLVDAR